MRPVSCHWLGRGGGGVAEEGRVIPRPVIVTRRQGLGGRRPGGRGAGHLEQLQSNPFSLSSWMNLCACPLQLGEIRFR